MPTFSSSEIEEAKRRVREMQSRAEGYVSGEKTRAKRAEELKDEPRKSGGKDESVLPLERKENENLPEDSEDSFLIILILIIILSREGADNKLLLALLYLLL